MHATQAAWRNHARTYGARMQCMSAPARAKSPTRSTNQSRRFRGDVALTRKARAAAVDTEDVALTQYLLRELKAARSPSVKPPACVYCHSPNTVLAGRALARRPMPAFQCQSCLCRFNRLTGTPLARLRHGAKLPLFVRLLSCQMSYKEAAEILQVDYSAIANWAEKFRTWLLTLDPSGAWEARARLGIKPRPVTACPQCGKSAQVRFFGFDHAKRLRRLVCRGCNVTWSMRQEQAARGLQTGIVHDPRLTQLRRQRERR